jgi:hypothetical protein
VPRFSRLLLLSLLPSCADTTSVRVRLHGHATFDPGSDLGEITLRVYEAETGDTVGGKGSGLVDGDDPVLEGVHLEPGASYRIRLSGVAMGCDGGQAAGESLPFTHDEDGDLVDVYVACHAESARAPDLPAPRAMHAATWVESESRVRVTGGTPRVTIGDMGPLGVGAEDSVFEMDLWSGEWVSATPMLTKRRLHVAADVPEGLAVLGGIGAAEDPLGSVELVAGSGTTPLGALDDAISVRSGAAVGDRVLVAGIGDGAGQSLARYDVAAGTTRFVDGAPDALGGAVVVGLDDVRALVVGGSSGAGEPGAVRLYCDSACASCETPPCLLDVGAEESLPGPDWSAASAAFVPCAAGGGAVVIGGGTVGVPPDASTGREIYCWRDEPEEIGTVVKSDFTLSSPRAAAPAGAIAKLGGGFWVVVAGGMRWTGAVVEYPSDADLLALNGCSCEIESVHTVPLPSGTDGATRTVGAAMTKLGDGSLLLVGGVADLQASARVLRFR